MKGKKLDSDGLWNYALRALGQRAHSAGDLKRKLAARAASPQDLHATMAKLLEYGLTDDRKFAEAFYASRLQNRGFGKLRVVRELRMRGVAPKIADEAARTAFQDVNEADLIEQFLHRNYKRPNLSEFFKEPKHLMAAYRKLRVAGFTSTVAIDVLKHYAKTAEELADTETGPEE